MCSKFGSSFQSATAWKKLPPTFTARIDDRPRRLFPPNFYAIILMPYTPPSRSSKLDSGRGAFQNLLHNRSNNPSSNRQTPSLKPPSSSLPLPPQDVIKFTTESPQSYSYTLLAPNSLALKLSVLKRSLEILLDRPELFPAISSESSDYFTQISQTYTPQRKTSTMALMDNVMRMERRVSQAPASPFMDGQNTTSTVDNELRKDLQEIINILESKSTSDDSSMDKVMGLQKLILDSKEGAKSKSLRKSLLYALATPFTDNSTPAANPYLLGSLPVNLPTPGSSPSVMGLVALGQAASNNRQFHLTTGGKSASPKAYFTCELDPPWNLKNANDLACLVFGISKASLSSLSLLDLIAPRARDLVLDRLCNGKELVFAGEIIAIKRNNMDIAWTSLWAKRKDNLIILIFEQVPCDQLDVVIENRTGGYYIKSSAKSKTSLFSDSQDLIECPLTDILPTMSQELEKSSENSSYLHSATINKSRYYTLKLREDKPVPCAVTSESLDEGSMRLNLHALPYISGAFVVSSKTLQIISFNHAIANNLFGKSDFKNKSVGQILPLFPKLVELAIEENPNIMYQQGLVLPEHYFRKLEAKCRASTEDEQEALFVSSTGIDALHRDGTLIKVDVQLRVMEYENYMLWITYSRAGSRKRTASESLKLNSSMEDLQLDSDSEEENMPSQMSLLPEVESDLYSCGGSSEGPSRSGSMKTAATADTVGSSGLKLTGLKKISATSDSSISATSKSVSNGSQKTSETEVDDQVQHTAEQLGEFRLDNMCSEKVLLERENQQIAQIRKESKYFPQKVGLARREKKFTDFTVIKNLGQGAYGKVVVAQRNGDPAYKLVIKAIFKERILVDTWVRDRSLGTIPSEIQIMNYLNVDPHPNLMRIVDFFEDDRCYYVETPQHGNPPAVDLFDLIEIKSDMTELECRYIFFQCCSAMAHLHSHGVVHRDIKDENIIVDNNYVVKLIDYGSAAYARNGPFGVFVGTIDYAAPEVLNGKPYEGKPQDVWAMGVLLYTLVFKENPFCNVDEIMDGGFNFPAFHRVSESCVDLICKILVKPVNDRPTMDEILKHPWLSGFN
ncbi:hypothetical protein OGAPHI_001446 [Ogataea philodendri]|uniref:non-specific serine/threonine protein kinase n=1 Tax=Ogataea philodendri TaxID=1378263 RepID=A0A9P8PCZ5_9ASCO|nr:uncharacterized protein OGAPHI_001446 [Ogataea philodendri]KAH3669325.1 hypothetical protein OGAPHI_001446 [Ogataea philodendri]